MDVFSREREIYLSIQIGRGRIFSREKNFLSIQIGRGRIFSREREIFCLAIDLIPIFTLPFEIIGSIILKEDNLWQRFQGLGFVGVLLVFIEVPDTEKLRLGN